MITIHWHPNPSELRRWALLTAAALGVMGTVFFFEVFGLLPRARGMAFILWGFGAFALVTAGTGTRAGLPAYWLWMGFVFVVGTVIGTVALGVVYYLVLVPTAVVARLMGRDRLRLREPRGASMWTPIANGGRHDPERQF
jgi:hypothetical protein